MTLDHFPRSWWKTYFFFLFLFSSSSSSSSSLLRSSRLFAPVVLLCMHCSLSGSVVRSCEGVSAVSGKEARAHRHVGLRLAHNSYGIGDRRMAFNTLPRLSFQNLIGKKRRLHGQNSVRYDGDLWCVVFGSPDTECTVPFFSRSATRTELE